MYRFRISPSFLEDYKNREPKWDTLGEITYYRTYSRFIEEENRNESWFDTVKRVVEGTFQIQKDHCEMMRLPWKNSKAQDSAAIMFDKIFNFKFTPPGRGLWMMGTEFIKNRGSAALNNCSFISTDDIDVRYSFVFTWAMDALMLGIGVGFDTKGAGLIEIKEPKFLYDQVFQIPDTREGWVESLGLVLDGFFLGRRIPKMDYSLIRPFGERIKGFGGVASGPGPLKNLHEKIIELLSSKIGDSLSSVDIVDIYDMIGVCVVAGNVRRSAMIAIGDYRDIQYYKMKSPDLYSKELMSHRWASNNSILVDEETDYTDIVNSICQNGEPGLVWLENLQKYGRMCENENELDYKAKGLNPCGEMTLESAEMCCLVESYPSNHDSYEEFEQTLKYAYLYAKTVTLLPTHWPETNQVMMKNRRIGVSQSGIIDAMAKHSRRELLDWSRKGYSYLKKMDKVYSDWLCVPRSLKITTVKPSGTVSILAGVSPGIHYPHSEYYIRRIRISAKSPISDILKKAKVPYEESKYGNTEEDRKNTLVFSLPMRTSYFKESKSDITIWEQLKNVVDYQRYWADNNVSVTVTLQKGEEKDLKKVIEIYSGELKAISFLPYSNGYEQAPYEEISEEKYNEMISILEKPDFSSLINTPEGVYFCEGDRCELK